MILTKNTEDYGFLCINNSSVQDNKDIHSVFDIVKTIKSEFTNWKKYTTWYELNRKIYIRYMIIINIYNEYNIEKSINIQNKHIKKERNF